MKEIKENRVILVKKYMCVWYLYKGRGYPETLVGLYQFRVVKTFLRWREVMYDSFMVV